MGLKLPSSVQSIADVLGRQRALFLIGKLPRCYVDDKRSREANRGGKSERVILYVPKTLKPDHVLVQILGWVDASRLVDAFGGELLCPGNCGDLYRPHRNAGIADAHKAGIPAWLVADWFDVSERHVRNVMALENPQQAVNDNSRQTAGHSTALTEYTAWQKTPELQRQ